MMKLLAKVNWRNIRKLSYDKLQKLAEEIREYIIDVVAYTGGHLGSNLGVVELTISLLRNFNPIKDKIIWDTSHQVYTYKILTDRRERFVTLRQYGGISGFASPRESKFDVYGAGHAGTALSAALGIAKARDIAKEDYHVVAVLGDASLTCGHTFEALNNLGYYPSNLIVVLNDNEYSIAKSVGALALHLKKLRNNPTVLRLEQKVFNIMDTLPFIGEVLKTASHSLEYSLDYILSSSFSKPLKEPILFDIFGFKYIGPVDGHNIRMLDDVFKLAKQLDGPVLIHVLTIKGKGYLKAETDAERLHGISPGKITPSSKIKHYTKESAKIMSSKEKLDRKPRYTDVFGRTLVELAERDKDIVAITAAMPSGTGLTEFAKRFPDRFFDVGIAEGHAVLFASGLAVGGKKPVVAIYSSFLQRAFDMIIHDVALQNLPVLFAIDRGGIVGDDGPTHHGVFDLSYLRMVPNFKIFVPKDENELRLMLYTALSDLNGPVAIRYPRGTGLGVPLEPYRIIDMYRWEELLEGEQVAVIAIGRTVKFALDTAELLERHYGLRPTVVNARVLKPLDIETLSELSATHEYLVTIEDNVLIGGLGSAVLEALNSLKIYRPVLTLGWDDEFIPHGDVDTLFRAYGLDPLAIAGRIKAWLDDVTKTNSASSKLFTGDLKLQGI